MNCRLLWCSAHTAQELPRHLDEGGGCCNCFEWSFQTQWWSWHPNTTISWFQCSFTEPEMFLVRWLFRACEREAGCNLQCKNKNQTRVRNNTFEVHIFSNKCIICENKLQCKSKIKTHLKQPLLVLQSFVFWRWPQQGSYNGCKGRILIP